MSIGTLRDRLNQIVQTAAEKKAACAKLNIDSGMLSRWLSGERDPEADNLAKIPEALGVSGHWLLTGEGPREAPGEAVIGPYRQARIEAVVEVRRLVLEAVAAVLPTTSAGEVEAALRGHKAGLKAARLPTPDQPASAPESAVEGSPTHNAARPRRDRRGGKP
jgi:transcriptional regulator with XRE-family HTH domain